MSSQEQGQVRSLNALSRRRALLTGLGCLLPGSAMAHHAPKQTRTGKGLHILTFSGKIAETQGKVLFKPYEQLTHQTIVPHGWNGQITDLQHFTGLTHFPLAAA